MQKTIYTFLLAILAFSIFSGCENDLDVSADWKEIAIVYGVLDPTESVNYLRIQRAYLDEKIAAVTFSDIPDSLYFDTLDVKITEFKNGTEGNTYQLRKVDGNKIGIPKDEGYFSSEYNYLYQMNAPVNASSYFDQYRYVLTIFNPKSGSIVSSETVSLGKSEMRSPINKNSKSVIIISGENAKFSFLYQEGKNARSYDMLMKIRVEEIDIADTNQRETKELKWVVFRNNRTKDLDGISNDGLQILPSNAFFQFLSSNLDSNLNVKRRLVDCDFETYGVGDDLNTYITVNEPSIGIVQKKPEFSNISNGYGIFSSRYVAKNNNIPFDRITRNAVMAHEATNYLRFVNY